MYRRTCDVRCRVPHTSSLRVGSLTFTRPAGCPSIRAKALSLPTGCVLLQPRGASKKSGERGAFDFDVPGCRTLRNKGCGCRLSLAVIPKRGFAFAAGFVVADGVRCAGAPRHFKKVRIGALQPRGTSRMFTQVLSLRPGCDSLQPRRVQH